MGVTEIAAIVFAVVTAGVVLFQLALALGVPWGEYAMGGKYPGRFPRGMRIAAAVQALFLVFTGIVVLSRGGLLFSRLTDAATWLIWAVVTLNAASFVLNVITPSRGERLRWGPTSFVLLSACLVVALVG